MTQEPIKFGPEQSSGYDPLSGAMPLAMNVVIDGAGVVRRRPCIASASNLVETQLDAAGVDGVYATVGGSVYAVAGTSGARSVYLIDSGASSLATDYYSSLLVGDKRPVFAETESILAIAGGAEPQKIVLADNTSSRLGGSPPLCSHIVANASRLIANRTDDYRGQLSFSDTAAGSSYTGFETWSGINTGFFSAEGRPDSIVATAENSNELFAWGTTTLQVFAPDPATTYAPLPVVEHGTVAPYSVIKFDQKFAWLDNFGRIVVGDGRNVVDVSGPIAGTLQELDVVSDCFGYRVQVGNYDCLAWTFPADGRTFVYQPGVGWSQWSGWDATREGWTRFAVNAHAYSPTTGENIVGTTDGYMGVLSLSAHQDLGETVNAKVRTGFETRGTNNRKKCNAIRVMLRRGEPSGTSGTAARLSYRDDPGASWQHLNIELGDAGDTFPVVEFRSMGVYRQRQWEFTFTGNDALSLISVVEDFDVLEM